MILRRYGTSMQSVELNFDSKALNEIGFRRDHVFAVPVDEFESGWNRLGVREMAPRDEGWVQDETEQALLDHLESEIGEMLRTLAEDEILVVENQQGVDYPKTRHSSKVVVHAGENRLFFSAWVEPPVKVARYCRK